MVFGGCRHGSQAARRTEHVNTVHRFHTRLTRPLVKTAPNDSLPLQKRGTFGQRDGQLVGQMWSYRRTIGKRIGLRGIRSDGGEIRRPPWNGLWNGDQFVVIG